MQVEESKENSKSFLFANALGNVDNLFSGGNFAHFIWYFFNAGLLVQKNIIGNPAVGITLYLVIGALIILLYVAILNKASSMEKRLRELGISEVPRKCTDGREILRLPTKEDLE